jgi:hypothetical protein
MPSREESQRTESTVIVSWVLAGKIAVRYPLKGTGPNRGQTTLERRESQ